MVAASWPPWRRMRARLQSWARPRHPEALPVQFDRRRVYVLPTRFGLLRRKNRPKRVGERVVRAGGANCTGQASGCRGHTRGWRARTHRSPRRPRCRNHPQSTGTTCRDGFGQSRMPGPPIRNDREPMRSHRGKLNIVRQHVISIRAARRTHVQHAAARCPRGATTTRTPGCWRLHVISARGTRYARRWHARRRRPGAAQAHRPIPAAASPAR